MSKFPKSMLASAVEDFSAIRFPKLASPKIDGIRATMHGGVLRTRSLKDVPNVHVQEKFKSLGQYDGLDGEMIVGDPWDVDVYDKTRRIVMASGNKPKAADVSEVRWYTFDRQGPLPFQSRLAGVFALNLRPDVIVVPHIVISNLEEMEVYEKAMLEKGFEGIMLRDPNGPYKHGRSSEKEGWLLKVKRYTDDEAKVISCYEEMGNNNEAYTNELGRTARSASKAGKTGNNTLGGFNVVGVTGPYKGVEFQVAVSSLTHDKRHDIWDARETQVDRILTYKWFKPGSEEKPRHPMFKGWRSAEDMSE
jgi:DNA ligase 1